MYVCVGHASGMCCVSLIVTYIRVCIICIDFGARPNALACIFLVVDMHCTTCENQSKEHSKRTAIVQLEWDLSLDLYHMYIVYIHVCALHDTAMVYYFASSDCVNSRSVASVSPRSTFQRGTHHTVKKGIHVHCTYIICTYCPYTCTLYIH